MRSRGRQHDGLPAACRTGWRRRSTRRRSTRSVAAATPHRGRHPIRADPNDRAPMIGGGDPYRSTLSGRSPQPPRIQPGPAGIVVRTVVRRKARIADPGGPPPPVSSQRSGRFDVPSGPRSMIVWHSAVRDDLGMMNQLGHLRPGRAYSRMARWRLSGSARRDSGRSSTRSSRRRNHHPRPNPDTGAGRPDEPLRSEARHHAGAHHP
jgi:hypothetical protein